MNGRKFIVYKSHHISHRNYIFENPLNTHKTIFLCKNYVHKNNCFHQLYIFPLQPLQGLSDYLFVFLFKSHRNFSRIPQAHLDIKFYGNNTHNSNEMSHPRNYYITSLQKFQTVQSSFRVHKIVYERCMHFHGRNEFPATLPYDFQPFPLIDKLDPAHFHSFNTSNLNTSETPNPLTIAAKKK